MHKEAREESKCVALSLYFKHLILTLFVNISENTEKDLVLNLVHGKQADSVVSSLQYLLVTVA